MFSKLVVSSSLILRPTTVRRTFALMPNEKLAKAVSDKIARVDKAIRENYEAIKPNLDPKEFDEARRKRLIYRSKQRGWLEADLLLGSWAVKFVPSLTEKEMDDYEIILREETIDVYNYISGKDPLPDHLKDMELVKRIQDYALKSNIIDPTSYADLKREHNLT